MIEQRTRDQQESPLQTERGITRVEDSVVQKIAGLAVQEIEGIQMGGGTARAVGGLLDNVSGSGGETRGVSVEVGEEETAIDLAIVLPTMMMPCLLYDGEADPLHPLGERCTSELPNAEFFSLPGLNHIQRAVRSDLVLPHVVEFLTLAPMIQLKREPRLIA